MPLTATERQRRSRAHRSGNHDFCDPARCLNAPDRRVTPIVTVTRAQELGFSGLVRAGRGSALEAIRDLIAGKLTDDLDPRDIAALSRELRAVLGEIDGISAGGAKESILDELARRRTERQQEATGT